LGYGNEAALGSERQKVIQAACRLSDSIPNALLVLFTRSGQTAHQAALLRPKTPIFAFTPESSLCSRFTLSRGVRSFKVVFEDDPGGTVAAAVDFLRHRYELEVGTAIIVVSEIHREGHALDCILVEHA
jgi:pyruvate kinase